MNIPFYNIKFYIIIIIFSYVILSLLIYFLYLKEKEKKEFDKPRKYEKTENEFEWNRIWEYHKCADDLFHKRFSFFLVAESMLVVSYATLFDINQAFYVKLAITLLGLIFTYGWYVVNIRLDKKMEFLKQYVTEPNDSYFEAYMKCVKDIRRWDIFNDEIFPISTFPFWEFLFINVILSIELIYIPLILIVIIVTGIFINKSAHSLVQENYEGILNELKMENLRLK